MGLPFLLLTFKLYLIKIPNMSFSRNKNLHTKLTINGKTYKFRTANERNAFEAGFSSNGTADVRLNNIEVEVTVAEGQTIPPGSPLIDTTITQDGSGMLVSIPAASTPGQEIVGVYRGKADAAAGDTISMVIRGEVDMKVNGTPAPGSWLYHDDSEPTAASFGTATDSTSRFHCVGDPVEYTAAGYKAVHMNRPFTTD